MHYERPKTRKNNKRNPSKAKPSSFNDTQQIRLKQQDSETFKYIEYPNQLAKENENAYDSQQPSSKDQKSRQNQFTALEFTDSIESNYPFVASN